MKDPERRSAMKTDGMKLMVYTKMTASCEVEPPLSLPTVSTAERE